MRDETEVVDSLIVIEGKRLGTSPVDERSDVHAIGYEESERRSISFFKSEISWVLIRAMIRHRTSGFDGKLKLWTGAPVLSPIIHLGLSPNATVHGRLNVNDM